MNVIVISLEKAPERRIKLSKQLKSLGIVNYIMDAVDGSQLSETELNKSIKIGRWRVGELFKPGEIGCTMSHLKALKIAKEKGWGDVIILEDDVVLANDFSKRIKYLKRILPKDWEHVYLSGIPKKEPLPTSLLFLNIVPSDFTECTHSMMVNQTSYDKIIEKLSKFETTTDDIYCDLISNKTIKSFTYYPFVTYADDTYTYIWNHELNREHKSKKYFRENLIK